MKDQVSIVTANSRPFRLVVRGSDDLWEPTLDQINSRTYDYVKLHRLSTYVDVAIAPFSLGVCFDGTLILPAIEKYRERSSALSKFNQTLVELLIGGLYCEAAEPNDIGYGSLSLDGYSRVHGGARGPAASFNTAARHKVMGGLDSIKLLKPEIISIEQLQVALAAGRELLNKVGPVPQEQILYGTTFFVKKQWAESLLHLWTTTERIVENAWQSHVLCFPSTPSKKRRAFLEDHRTWTVSAKLEVLHQKGLLPAETYAVLDTVRKARNDFAHRGSSPDYSIARDALRGCFEMASLCASNFERIDLFSKVIELTDSRCNPELYPQKTHFDQSELSHWLAIPPLPGDPGWGDQPYEIIEDLRLHPLKGGA